MLHTQFVIRNASLFSRWKIMKQSTVLEATRTGILELFRLRMPHGRETRSRLINQNGYRLVYREI
jgi:hypothetical protein